MPRLSSIIRKLARPADRELLDRSPTLVTRLRVMGRIGLRFWWIYLIVLFLLSLGTVSAGMDVYHRTEQPQFCGACHEMSNNFETWRESRHKNITCADCHAEQSATGWLRTKVAGARQLVTHFSAESIDNIKVQEDQRGVIDSNCRRCHAGLARVGERFGLGVSHRQHLEKGLQCITCHSGSFTHPVKQVPATESAASHADKNPAEAAAADADAPEPKASQHSGKALLESRFVDVAECYKCHDGKTTVGDTVAFSAEDETKCSKCHPDADQALAHGARHSSSANRKPCLDCHDTKSGGAHFTMGDVALICGKCHEKKEHQSMHNPYSRGECSECHSVMSQAYLFKSGPRPTNAGCLVGCHDSITTLLAEKKPAELSAFSDGAVDLHKLHADELGKTSNDWCLACHAPHFSDSMRALVSIRQQDDFKTRGTATLTMYSGGSCQGGCHIKKLAYSGPE